MRAVLRGDLRGGPRGHVHDAHQVREWALPRVRARGGRDAATAVPGVPDDELPGAAAAGAAGGRAAGDTAADGEGGV